MKTKPEKLKPIVANLRRLGYRVDVKHNFKGGVDKQALEEPQVIKLPTGKFKEVTGICQVKLTAPDGKVTEGIAITAEPYCKKMGVKVALGRVLASLRKGISIEPCCTLISAS